MPEKSPTPPPKPPYSKEDVINQVKLRLAQAKTKRVQWEAWCATVQNFFDGKHRSWWTEDGQLINKPLAENEIWRQVNMFPGTEDKRIDRLTKNDPRWHVKPSHLFVASAEDIDVANAYLQYVYKTRNWKDQMKQVASLGDRRGLCPAVVGWDEESQMCTLEYYDPWDFYPDDSSAHPSGWFFLLTSVPKSLDWVKSREDITEELRNKIESESVYAQSKLKDQLERARNGGQLPKDQVLYNQFFVRTSNGIFEYQVIGDNCLKDPVLLPYKSFDEFIDIYKPRDSQRFYERPPCSDWVDMQKSINKVFSSIEGYIDMMLHGRWRRLDKTIAVPVGGQHGQIIDAAVGDIEQFDMLPLPQTHFQHLDRAVTFFENVSQVHEVSFGRLPGSVESGVGISTLQLADESNSSSAVQQFQSFLSRIATKVLYVTSKNLQIKRPIYIEEEPGHSKRIDVIGEDMKTLRDLKNVAGIKPFDNVEVEIILGSAFSDYSQQQTVLELMKSGYVPGQNPVMDRLVVTFWRLGGQREVMKMLEDMRDPDRLVAAAENMKMRGGAFIAPQASDNHQIHMEIHTNEAKMLQSLGDLKAAQNVLDHIEEHREILDAKRSQVRSAMEGKVGMGEMEGKRTGIRSTMEGSMA